MFYKYRLNDNRITVSGPDPLTADGVVEEVIELADETAYHDIAQAYRVTTDLLGIEVDPTYTPPPFDLSRAELRAILKLIVDQFNAVRTNAGMPEITYAQARDAIKEELGL